MKNSIVCGKTAHKRFHSKEYFFSYPLYLLCLNLDDLENKKLDSWLLGYNKKRILSIQSKEYFFHYQGNTLREKIEQIVRDSGFEDQLNKIFIYTTPAILGYIFNPLTLFYCFDAQDKLVVVIAWVESTFGEFYPYVLYDPIEEDEQSSTFCIKKEVFISPFSDIDGNYIFKTYQHDEQKMLFTMEFYSKQQKIFYANISGDYYPYTTLKLVQCLLKYSIPDLFRRPFQEYIGRKLARMGMVKYYVNSANTKALRRKGNKNG